MYYKLTIDTFNFYIASIHTFRWFADNHFNFYPQAKESPPFDKIILRPHIIVHFGPNFTPGRSKDVKLSIVNSVVGSGPLSESYQWSLWLQHSPVCRSFCYIIGPHFLYFCKFHFGRFCHLPIMYLTGQTVNDQLVIHMSEFLRPNYQSCNRTESASSVPILEPGSLECHRTSYGFDL